MQADNGLKGVKGWRLNKELAGGGPLMDVGIYCVQGIRYTTGLEPLAVKAKEGEKKDIKKFKEVEESLTWEMEMPDGIVARCKTSYSEEMNLLRAEAENGWFEISPRMNTRALREGPAVEKWIFPRSTSKQDKWMILHWQFSKIVRRLYLVRWGDRM